MESCPGINQVGEKKVGVKFFMILQPGQGLVGQHGVVLENDAQGQLGIELPVPPGTEDMVGEDTVTRADAREPCQYIAVVAEQMPVRPQGEAEISFGGSGKVRVFSKKRNKIDLPPEFVGAVEVQLGNVLGTEF